VLEEGAQIVADPDQPVPMTMLGHVTSSYHSATLGRSIAMAVIADGRARDGQVIHVPMPGRTIRARVTASTVFYDPEGAASMSDAIAIPALAVAGTDLALEARHDRSGVALTLERRPAAGRCAPARRRAGRRDRPRRARAHRRDAGWLACLGSGRMAGRPARRHRAARWRRAAGQRGGHFRARVVIRVEGAGAARTVASGCPLDVERFAVGRATRTVYETVEVILWRESETTFRVFVWRSFARGCGTR
jgi:hypothetical protein